MSKIIVVTSGKGGVGKTTCAVNLGAALNSLNENVLLVDANLTTPNIGLHLGAPVVPISLNHVLLGKATIEDSIYEHSSGTKIIPSSLSIKELKKINHSKLKYFGKKFKKYADYVIFDCAAGLGSEALAAIESADELVLVCNPEMPSVADALKTLKVAEEFKKEIKGVIITRYKGRKSEMSIKSIKEMLEVPVLGIIPEDKKVQEALAMKSPVFTAFPKSKSSRNFKIIANRLIGKKSEIKRNFLDKFLEKVGF